jgi:hypothetical protein
MGLVASPTLVASQSSVGWQERGVVTGNNLFCRSIGSALGVAVFGAIANATLGSNHSTLSTGHVSAAALTAATQHVFIGVAVLSVAIAVAVALMPRVGAPDTTGSPSRADLDQQIV